MIHLGDIFKIFERKSGTVPLEEFLVQRVKIRAFAVQIHMTFYAEKPCVMLTDKCEEFLPKFLVFDRLFCCVSPAILFP